MKPYISIDLQKLKSNIINIVKYCERRNIGVIGVIKCACGDPLIISLFTKSGVARIADSRIENLKKLDLKGLDIPVLLLRSPALSEVDDVIGLADISVNTELEVLKALSEAALKYDRIHNVILMVELGDNREGIPPDELLEMARKVSRLKGLKLAGISTNFTCLSNKPPTIKQLKILDKLAREIVNYTGIELDIVSGGGSSVLPLLSKGTIPKSINDLRIGDSILLGCSVPEGTPLSGLYQDVFKIAGEIIEIKFRKNGTNTGKRRAIIGFGSVDTDIHGLTPCLSEIDIVGGTSDHMVLDVTFAKHLRIGDWVQFIPDYHALVKCLSSIYINKVFLSNASTVLNNGIAL